MLELPETVQVIILAVVQGIAEFLPISSSGHLVVINALMGGEGGSLELNVVLHFGTLLAILVFYRQRIIELLTRDRRVIPLLIIGTIPAGVIGLYLKKYHTGLLENPLVAGFMLVVTGFMLMLFTRIPNGTRKYPQLTIPPVLAIGLAQAAALLPGISRSGATIVMGTATGLERQSAATFSFLLAIPAIAGATLLEAKDMLEQGAATPVWLLATGCLIAFVVGLGALRWLVKWIEQGKLHLFMYWLIPFGFSIVVWQLYEMVRQSGEATVGL